MDLFTVDRLGSALGLVVAAGATAVVDLRRVAFIDSTGLAVLLRYAGQARDRPFDLVVVRSSPAVQRLFAMTGVERSLQMLDVPEQARRRA